MSEVTLHTQRLEPPIRCHTWDKVGGAGARAAATEAEEAEPPTPPKERQQVTSLTGR